MLADVAASSFDGLSDSRSVNATSVTPQSTEDKGRQIMPPVATVLNRREAIKAESDWVLTHFSEFFSADLAQTSEELNAAFRIRHEVFCEETKIFKEVPTRLESDKYDDYAKQVLIRHIRTGDYAGCVRLIMPENDDQLLPIETHGIKHIDDKSILPEKFKRNEVAEVSRILIPKIFRRRKTDLAPCAEQTAIDILQYNENDKRCFPFIAVGLYMACTAVFKNCDKKHIYFMADPRLGKSMQMVGLTMQQIGPEFEYVGRRVPYYIDFEKFLHHLKPSFETMLAHFTSRLR